MKSSTTDDKMKNETRDFGQETMAAENRLEMITARTVPSVSAKVNDVEVSAEGLRVLAVIVEERDSLDPAVGSEVKGVSRTVIKQVMDFESTSNVKYWFEKLEDAGLIEQWQVDGLPEEGRGSNPIVGRATERGRLLVEGQDLLPILQREYDLEELLMNWMGHYRDLYEKFAMSFGYTLKMRDELQRMTDMGLDLGQPDELEEFGYEVLEWDPEPEFLQVRDDDLLLGEMSPEEQQVMIDELTGDDGDR